jgi:hypothetical protein
VYHKTKGISLIKFVISLVILIFFAYLIRRLAPMYFEYFSVVEVMEQESRDLNKAMRSLDQIHQDLAIKFDTQYIDTNNVPLTAITLTQEDGVSALRVNYERRVPLFYNLDIVGTFDKSIKLTNAGAE